MYTVTDNHTQFTSNVFMKTKRTRQNTGFCCLPLHSPSQPCWSSGFWCAPKTKKQNSQITCNTPTHLHFNLYQLVSYIEIQTIFTEHWIKHSKYLTWQFLGPQQLNTNILLWNMYWFCPAWFLYHTSHLFSAWQQILQLLSAINICPF